MRRLLLAATALVAASVSSFAATVTYSGSFGPSTTNFTTVTPLSQFDPALGTLTGITFTITGTSSGSATVTNNSGDDATYTINIATNLRMRTPGGTVLTQVTPLFNDPNFFVADGQTKTDSGTSTPSTLATNFGGSFVPYIGTGLINFDVRGTGQSGFSGPSGSPFSSTTSAVGTDSVTYTYTPPPPPSDTPEPATMGLFGSALIGIGLLRFRSKK